MPHEHVKCFWLEATARARVSLRRYVGESICGASGMGYHNASIYLEERPARLTAEGYLMNEEHPLDDPRWPARCACGYVFADHERKQVFVELIYRRADTGATMTLREAPAGAMWNAWWMGEHHKGPDGIALVVKLPDAGEWLVDGPSYQDGKIQNAKGWTRTGTPPMCTATPSILTPRYHGFLTNGELRAC